MPDEPMKLSSTEFASHRPASSGFHEKIIRMVN